MEKFKRHTDAATGVNPFVIAHRPHPGSVAIACVLFPFRLLVAALVALILVLLEMPLHILRQFGLRAVGAIVLHPLISLLLRLQLLVLCNMTVHTRYFPPRPTLSVYSNRSNSSRPADDTQESPRPGELVLVNMQSPLDILAIAALGLLPGQIAMPACMVVFPLPDGTTLEMWPSPFQKLKVMRHVLWTGSEGFFRVVDARRSERDLKLDLRLIQQRAKRMGVPVLYFAEGTCGNGRGLLHFLPIACEGALHVLALHYNTQQVHTITKARFMGGTKFLFAAAAGLWGLFRAQRCTALIVRPSNIPEADASFSDAWAQGIRTKMCAALTAQDSRAACRPVSSGFSAKRAFVEHYWAVVDGKTIPP